MENIMSAWLSLVVATSFLPSIAMEKEKQLTKADKALLDAADKNNLSAAIAALKDGADVNAQDQDENTALHKAIQHENYTLVEALFNKKLDPCIVNKYGHYPLLYISDKMSFLHQYNITAFTTSKAIRNQIKEDLITSKKVNQKKLNQIGEGDQLIAFFNKTIGKKKKHFKCAFYSMFFYQVAKYILIALEDSPEKAASKFDLDPSLPYFDLSLAQKKVSHLLRILKIINSIGYTTLHKPLAISKNNNSGIFILFSNFKTSPNAGLISIYGLQVKTIIDNPTKYIHEIKQKLILEDKLQWLASASIRIVTLLHDGAHLPSFNADKNRIQFIVANAPESLIKPELFASAFTSFAQYRK